MYYTCLLVLDAEYSIFNVIRPDERLEPPFFHVIFERLWNQGTNMAAIHEKELANVGERLVTARSPFVPHAWLRKALRHTIRGEELPVREAPTAPQPSRRRRVADIEEDAEENAGTDVPAPLGDNASDNVQMGAADFAAPKELVAFFQQPLDNQVPFFFSLGPASSFISHNNIVGHGGCLEYGVLAF